MATGNLTGTLTLTGIATDVWVFQITGTTLTTAGASNIVMAGGANSCNVFWQVGSSATLGGASTFRGSIFANTSITVGDNTNLVGRAVAGAVALSGAVTMSGDGGTTIGQCPTQPVPTSPVWALIMLTALLALAGFVAMRRQAM
jgi:type VI secretion system secreted protein VgrG